MHGKATEAVVFMNRDDVADHLDFHQERNYPKMDSGRREGPGAGPGERCPIMNIPCRGRVAMPPIWGGWSVW